MNSKLQTLVFIIFLLSPIAPIRLSRHKIAAQQTCTGAVTNQEIQDLLWSHNSYRNSIASGTFPGFAAASNMVELLWDGELQTLAQNWVNTKPLGHNPSRSIPSKPGNWIGENIYWIWGTSTSVSSTNSTNSVKSWFSEYANYKGVVSNFTAGTNPDGTVVGHFTQVIWANTTRVGCGILRCPTNVTVICDYWYGGNILKKPIYQTGTVASKCPSRSTTFSSLCKGV